MTKIPDKEEKRSKRRLTINFWLLKGEGGKRWAEFLVHVCLFMFARSELALELHGWGNSHAGMQIQHAQDHWANITPELSPPATYEWPLQRLPTVTNVTGGGRRRLLKIIASWFRAARKEKLLSCNQGNNRGWPLHKRAFLAGALEKDERHPLVCPPLSCCKVDTGLCLHCATSYSKGSLVCSRLLRWRCAKLETLQVFGVKMQTEEPEKQHVMPCHTGSWFANILAQFVVQGQSGA